MSGSGSGSGSGSVSGSGGCKLSLGEFKERLRVLREENPGHWAASFGG